MEKTFIDYLRQELQEAKDTNTEFGEELSHFSDMVKLLCDILSNDAVDRTSRTMILSALGYLLVPNDLIPEEVYGVYGYMEDMYLVCLVLKGLVTKHGDLIGYLWTHDDDFNTVLDECFYVSGKYLEEKGLKDKVLRYCGMSD
jgi:uncharacterized membrane protein YkvA (DUF1232 family)